MYQELKKPQQIPRVFEHTWRIKMILNLYCVFAILYIAYLYIIILLSVSCPVAVILLHCGASVTITNPSSV